MGETRNNRQEMMHSIFPDDVSLHRLQGLWTQREQGGAAQMGQKEALDGHQSGIYDNQVFDGRG